MVTAHNPFANGRYPPGLLDLEEESAWDALKRAYGRCEVCGEIADGDDCLCSYCRDEAEEVQSWR